MVERLKQEVQDLRQRGLERRRFYQDELDSLQRQLDTKWQRWVDQYKAYTSTNRLYSLYANILKASYVDPRFIPPTTVLQMQIQLLHAMHWTFQVYKVPIAIVQRLQQNLSQYLQQELQHWMQETKHYEWTQLERLSQIAIQNQACYDDYQHTIAQQERRLKQYRRQLWLQNHMQQQQQQKPSCMEDETSTTDEGASVSESNPIDGDDDEDDHSITVTSPMYTHHMPQEDGSHQSLSCLHDSNHTATSSSSSSNNSSNTTSTNPLQASIKSLADSWTHFVTEQEQRLKQEHHMFQSKVGALLSSLENKKSHGTTA